MLARKPRADAIPVLEEVVRTSEQPERDAALSTLRTLAQSQGDGDERIRNSLREMISHTSNEALILSAQETLDQIEQDIIAAAQGTSP